MNIKLSEKDIITMTMGIALWQDFANRICLWQHLEC